MTSSSSVNVSLTSSTTADEDSPALSEEEEGISSADADESILQLLGNQRKDHGKTLLKIKDKVLIKNKVCSSVPVPHHNMVNS